MLKSLRLIICFLALAFFVASALFAGGPSAGSPPPPAQSVAGQEARPLTPQERRGKAVYLRGESSSKQEITATIGEVEVPASVLACAGCHGVRGEGKTEGGVSRRGT